MMLPSLSQQERIMCAQAITAVSGVHDIETCTAKQYKSIAAVIKAEKIRFDISICLLIANPLYAHQKLFAASRQKNSSTQKQKRAQSHHIKETK